MNYELISLIFVFIVLSIIFGICGIILFYIIKFLRNKFNIEYKFLKNRNLKIIIILTVLILAVYESYTAVFPRNNFYYKEFEFVTLEKVPKSAKIKFKESSYPDLHGDYFSKSKMELSASDFTKLLNKIESENKLNKLPPQNTNQLVTFQRKIKGESDKLLFITFLKDRKTILINVDVY